ncbi:MAG: efflux RND transporter periplasmic adaptor subunit [Verrucomicrobiota bacterium]
MSPDTLEKLRIASEQKRRPRGPIWMILGSIALVLAAIAYFAVPRASDSIRTGMKSGGGASGMKDTAPKGVPAQNPGSAGTLDPTGTDRGLNAATNRDGATYVLRTSGYIVARERIEVSPRFMGLVTWIGIKKGDSVTNGQVVVRLDDSEYRARLAEVEGQLSVARVAEERARIDLDRTRELFAEKVESQQVLDNARLALESAQAQIRQLEGARRVILTYLDWCVIRSPVNGVVLEKLAEANELVTPQNFGGSRGPSTSLLAVADLEDLQVEIDVNEQELARIALGQTCRVSPEAYPDRFYNGVVAEIAPEASRQKGTLQIKVQILGPDKYLTPELSAKVDFLPLKSATP